MSHHVKSLEIESWTEGPSFELQVGAVRGNSLAHPTFFVSLRAEESIMSQTLKPVGFYVAYSYTLFRKGNDPQNPLYAFF